MMCCPTYTRISAYLRTETEFPPTASLLDETSVGIIPVDLTVGKIKKVSAFLVLDGTAAYKTFLSVETDDSLFFSFLFFSLIHSLVDSKTTKAEPDKYCCFNSNSKFLTYA